MTVQDITNKIRNGEIDINNQSLFFSILIKGLLVKLRQDIKIRDVVVPHFILNTGDEVMSLEVKGYDHSQDPIEATNENYIYNTLPRCAVSPKGVTLMPDQLTSPYTTGSFQIEYDDQVLSYVAEFRRMPLKMSIDLKYVVDTYTDTLALVQQLITKLAFIKTFNISYMGQQIPCSYTLPDSMDDDKMIEFEENITDDRRRHIELSIEVETNIPIYSEQTVIPADKYIKNMNFNPGTPDEGTYRLMVLPVNGIEHGDIGEDPHAPYKNMMKV